MEVNQIKEYFVFDVYKYGKTLLKDKGIECYSTDVLLIFEKCFGLNYTEIITNKNKKLSPEKVDIFDKMLHRRISGEPVYYIIGSYEFMGVKLSVGPGVLVPRDDTEVLVRESINVLKDKVSIRPINKLKIVDLCSGSGAIALSINKYFNNYNEVYAIELSRLAFSYLKYNIYLNNSCVKPILGNISNNFSQFNNSTIDAIISNPPYISSKDIKILDEEVKKEPLIALDGGLDGLNFYRIICSNWVNKLKKDGFIAVEVGVNQSNTVKEIFHSAGLINVETYSDINKIERVVIGYKN